MASIILGRVVVEFAREKSLISNGNGRVDGHVRIGNRELKLPKLFFIVLIAVFHILETLGNSYF